MKKTFCTEEVKHTTLALEWRPVSAEDESINPAPNPVVLTCVFDTCDLAELPSLRQVSRLWDALLVDRFRNEMRVVIRAPPFVSCKQEGSSLKDANKGLDWETVNSELVELKGKPFKNFRIVYMEFSSPSSQFNCGVGGSRNFRMMRRSMGDFLGEFGSWIRKLELCHVQVHCVEAFKRAIWEETPNLEELRLGEVENKTGHEPTNSGTHEGIIKMQPNLKHVVVKTLGLPMTWYLFLRYFPNIQCLEVVPAFKETEMDDIQRNFADISEQLVKRKHCKFIAQKLVMMATTAEEIRTAIRVIQTPNLTLLQLILIVSTDDIVDGDVVVDHVTELECLFATAFRLHGSTLERIHLTDASSRWAQRIDNFPCYPGPFNTVKKLILVGSLCKNVHFLEHFPNLEELSITYADVDMLANTESRRIEKLALNKVKDVEFVVDRLALTLEGMELLVKLMPNVVIFHGNLSNVSLMVLCREWRQLTRLTIGAVYPHDNTIISDEGMTGMVAGSDLRLPNITDLHDLESLVIRRGISVGDDSICNGFLKMPRLQKLEVELSLETSEGAFAALAKKIPGGGITRLPGRLAVL